MIWIEQAKLFLMIIGSNMIIAVLRSRCSVHFTRSHKTWRLSPKLNECAYFPMTHPWMELLKRAVKYAENKLFTPIDVIIRESYLVPYSVPDVLSWLTDCGHYLLTLLRSQKILTLPVFWGLFRPQTLTDLPATNT